MEYVIGISAIALFVAAIWYVRSKRLKVPANAKKVSFDRTPPKIHDSIEEKQ